MTTLVERAQSDRSSLSFLFFGTRISVTAGFLIMTLFMGGNRDLIGAFIWVAVCFISILLHELGHVYAFRAFGCKAEVLLYGFGGLAIPDRPVRGTLPEILVSIAGPAAGFCLAGITAGAVVASGGHVFAGWHLFLPYASATLSPNLFESGWHYLLPYYAMIVINDLLWVNFYWGIVNLLPVWPLDGGHVARALFTAGDRYDGLRKFLILSASVAGAVALSALVRRSFWLAIMFGALSVSSIQSMRGERRRPIPAYRRWRD